jgi:hypothetical protein
MNNRYHRPTDVQKHPLTGRVEIRLVRFLDSMAMAGHLAVRQNGMGQLFTHLGKGVRLLDENISMAVLISHGHSVATHRAKAIPKMRRLKRSQQLAFSMPSAPLKFPAAVYLVFQGPRTALINSDTLKMNFVSEKESGISSVEFGPGFKYALGVKEDGHYLGAVQTAP